MGIVAIDARHAWVAGEIRGTRYSRQEASLSLADCLLLAGAREDDRIATSDRALIEGASLRGIDVIPLPDSSGRRPDVA